MDKERLQYIINNPQSINDNDIEMLSSIVAEYPYFTLAQILLAIGFDLTEDKRQNRQLRLASAMSPDRNALRLLLSESKEKKEACDLPDEFGNESQQTLESVVIPEIDLSKSQEELSREMDLLEEKRKSLDELKYLIEQRIIELPLPQNSSR